MPISATGNSEEGFTLVELIVVIAIIAVATAVVVLTMPDPRGRVRVDAEKFAARALAARDDAILQSRDVRVWVTATGYGVDRRRQGQWVAQTERPFAPARWSEGTGAIVGTAGRAQIAFDATGAAASPVTVTLVRDAERATVTVSGNGAVRVGS